MTHNHHRLIRALIAALRQSRQERDALHDALWGERQSHSDAAEAERQEAQRAQQQANDKRARRYEYETAARMFEQAVERGDTWAIERAYERLGRL